MSSAPPPRHYIVSQFALLCTIMVWSYLMGVGLKRTPNDRLRFQPMPLLTGALAVGLAALLLIGPIASFARAADRLPNLATYAAEWDARDQRIRAAVAAGATTMTVAPLSIDLGKMAQLDVLGSDPNAGFNRCAADYYGLTSLSVRQES